MNFFLMLSKNLNMKLKYLTFNTILYLKFKLPNISTKPSKTTIKKVKTKLKIKKTFATDAPLSENCNSKNSE